MKTKKDGTKIKKIEKTDLPTDYQKKLLKIYLIDNNRSICRYIY